MSQAASLIWVPCVRKEEGWDIQDSGGFHCNRKCYSVYEIYDDNNITNSDVGDGDVATDLQFVIITVEGEGLKHVSSSPEKLPVQLAN